MAVAFELKNQVALTQLQLQMLYAMQIAFL